MDPEDQPRHVPAAVASQGTPPLEKRKRAKVEHYSPAGPPASSLRGKKRKPTTSATGNEDNDEKPQRKIGSSVKKKGQEKTAPPSPPSLTATKQLVAATTSLVREVHSLSDRMLAIEQSSAGLSPVVENNAAPLQASSILPHSMMPAAESGAESGSSNSVEDLLLGMMDDQVHLQRLHDEADGLRRRLRVRQVKNVFKGMKW